MVITRKECKRIQKMNKDFKTRISISVMQKQCAKTTRDSDDMKSQFDQSTFSTDKHRNIKSLELGVKQRINQQNDL